MSGVVKRSEFHIDVVQVHVSCPKLWDIAGVTAWSP